MPKLINLEGKEFGRLKVLGRDWTRRNRAYWKCQCGCGNMVSVTTAHLTDGSTNSCGCLRAEASAKRLAATADIMDLTAYKFDLLKPINIVGKADNGSYLWYCKCDCGGHTLATRYDLFAGRVRSCGCISNPGDLTNHRFGRLVVKEFAYVRDGQRYWKCECTCPEHNIVYASTNRLRFRQVQSCGCLRRDVSREIHIMHGDSKSRLYRIWANMWSRCSNPDADVHDSYWSLGVSVAKDWAEYTSFRDWALRSGYVEGLSLDRQNPFKSYSPDNCRWIPLGMQEQNKRETYLKVAHDALQKSIGDIPTYIVDDVTAYLVQTCTDTYWSNYFVTHDWDALDVASMDEMILCVNSRMQAVMLLAVITVVGHRLSEFVEHDMRKYLLEIRARAYQDLMVLQKEFDKYGWELPQFSPDEVLRYIK